MNGRRSKWISKLVVTMDPNLYVMLINRYGEGLQKMGSRRAYKIAKRWWSQQKPGVEKWGKISPKSEKLLNELIAKVPGVSQQNQQNTS